MMNTNYTNKQTILWVDDDPDDIYLIRQVLNEIKFNSEMIPFQNGKEVIDHLSAIPKEAYPCLIILDINMPVMDGKQTLSTLKKSNQFSSIPVIMFSTSNNTADKLFCQHFGAELVTKPSTYNDLKGIVANLVKGCSSALK